MSAPSLAGLAVPDFTAAMTGGRDFRLSDFVGQKTPGRQVVLYFYPKDNTPGCTVEGQDFRDAHAAFAAANTAVFGVSRDSVKSHESFKAKFSFPFELIADPTEAVCAMFDVMQMKNMYGKQVRGVERSTFLIGADGRIKREWRGVKVAGHVAQVLEAAKS
jgi:thioredoxin-dependent peroxiredoxin